MLCGSGAGQRQRAADFQVAQTKQWSTWLRRCRCLFFVLILAAVLFFCTTDVKEISPNLWNPFSRSPHAVNVSTNDSGTTTEPIAAGQSGMNYILSLLYKHVASTESMQTSPNAPVILLPHRSLVHYLGQYPYDYGFIINQPHVCEKPFVVLMVPVTPSNRLHRDIIRKTWGGKKLILGKVVTQFFLVGRHNGDGAQAVEEQLLQESKQHQDVIQSDFLDCYKNLTIKSMVMLTWLETYCSSASYAMKVDSDTFLNVHNLVNMLLTAKKDNYMTGYVERQAVVQRDPNSKWYVSPEQYPPSHYPPYALGLGYILSMDLPKKLLEASKHVKMLYIEDVYLGLCMEHLAIPLTDPPNILNFKVVPETYNRCIYYNLIVTVIAENTDLVEIYKDLQRPGPYC